MTKKNTPEDQNKRDFLQVSTYALGAVGAASFVWPLIDQMNPAADTLALASTEVDLEALEEGQSITVKWRGKPVFIRHRTKEEISSAKDQLLDGLRDPQTDDDRVQNDKYIVLVGVCTHLGCVPLGQKSGDVKGEYGGWFCPCHGSHYDHSGRIRKGPAPTNLEVPKYSFLSGEPGPGDIIILSGLKFSKYFNVISSFLLTIISLWPDNVLLFKISLQY